MNALVTLCISLFTIPNYQQKRGKLKKQQQLHSCVMQSMIVCQAKNTTIKSNGQIYCNLQ